MLCSSARLGPVQTGDKVEFDIVDSFVESRRLVWLCQTTIEHLVYIYDANIGEQRFVQRRKVIRPTDRSCIISSLESTSRSIPSASPVLSRFTSSFTCQHISVIIPALIIHHSFTLSLQAQNLPFQQTLSTLDFFYLLDCLHDNGTGPDLSRSSFYF